MTPAHKGQYMSSSATSNKVKLEGLPDNSPGVRGPYNEASPSLGRAQLRGWLATCYAPTHQVKGALDIWCGGEKGQSSTVRLPSLTSSKEGGQPGVPGRISPGGLVAKAGVGVQRGVGVVVTVRYR